MEKSLKQDWLDRLRCGEYTQGSGALYNQDNQYCCLGVLADCLIDRGIGQWDVSYSPVRRSVPYVVGDDIDYDLLPENVAHVFIEDESRTAIQETLANMNDDGKTFAEIADYIEENVDLAESIITAGV